MREKVGKSRNTVFFQWFGAPEGRKVGSLKRRVQRHLGRWEMKSCTPLWREAHFQVKMYKTHQLRTTFGSCDVEKVHAVVARSTFPSQNVQNTPASDHFWKLRCRKSARSCGAKHISKSKCTKHTMLGPLLEVQMSKKCTPLWREAHFQVKSVKNWRSQTTFGSWDVEKVHAVEARCTFRSQNVKNTRGSDHFWRFRCPFASLHDTTLHYTTLHYTTLHYTTLHYTPLHYTTLHYTALPSTTLHYITLHYNYNYDYTTTLHYTKLHYTPLQYTPLHSTTLNYTTLHYITLHSTTLHYTTLPSTTLHYITLHYTPLQLQLQLRLHNYTPLHSTTRNYYTTLHYATLHSTTLHYTTLHYTTLHYTEWHCTTDRQVDR